MTKIIGLSGRKQSGKSTTAEAILEYYFLSNNNAEEIKNDIIIYNFADTLKNDICINILDFTYGQCYGDDEEKNELVDCYLDNKQLTAREVMQYIGTDIFRKLKTDVWITATLNKIKKDNPKIAIIADCRFPDEIEALKKFDSVIIKFTRNPYNSDHASEIALDPDRYDHRNFDFVLMNDSLTIDQKDRAVIRFLQKKAVL